MKIAIATRTLSESRYRVCVQLIAEDTDSGEKRQLTANLPNQYEEIAIWESSEASNLMASDDWPDGWEPCLT